MKKFFTSVFIVCSATFFLFAQADEKKSSPKEFTRAEALSYKSILDFLSAVNPAADYSKYTVRSFDLSYEVVSASGEKAKTSLPGPGGTWSEKQIQLLEHSEKGNVYTIENIRAIESGKKGVQNLPDFSFVIKD